MAQPAPAGRADNRQRGPPPAIPADRLQGGQGQPGQGPQDRDDSSHADSEEGMGWMQWFCNVPGHQFFVEVDEEYIKDNFNLYGLKARIQYYDHAIEMILMPDSPDEEDLQDGDFLEVYRDAQDLYGLIHARFIISPRGLALMRQHYEKGMFGTCPRLLCNRQPLLPIGTSDEMRISRVKTFCPLCEQLYATKQKYPDVDGAYFGTSFPHIFCLTYPNLLPSVGLTAPRTEAEMALVQRSRLTNGMIDSGPDGVPPGFGGYLPSAFIPKLFGFRVQQHKGVIGRHRDRAVEDLLKSIDTRERRNRHRKMIQERSRETGEIVSDDAPGQGIKGIHNGKKKTDEAVVSSTALAAAMGDGADEAAAGAGAGAGAGQEDAVMGDASAAKTGEGETNGGAGAGAGKDAADDGGAPGNGAVDGNAGDPAV